MTASQAKTTDAGVRGCHGSNLDQGGGGGGGGGGVGTVGEPELHMLVAIGEPTSLTVVGAIGKPAKFSGGGGGGGVGTIGEPELHSPHAGCQT